MVNVDNILKAIWALFFLVFNIGAFAQDVKTYIPPKAEQLLPELYGTINKTYVEFKYPVYFAALIEHESCISLTHSRCWSPTSRLKTSREEGAGLGQLTRAYRSDGTLRFDTIRNLREKYRELRELNWDNVYKRPDLQMKAIVLLYKENHSRLKALLSDDFELLAMADAAYNGGLSGVTKDRTLCKFKKGCNPDYWFNNVELTCGKSKKILYSNRNACDINRHHVRDVLLKRLPKYINDYNKTYCN